MNLDDIRAKKRRNEEAQDDLLLSRRKFEYQMDETRYAYAQDRRLKEEVLAYFYGEPEQYLFADGIEENDRNERLFLASSDEMTGQLLKEEKRLVEENESLYKQELDALREEDMRG